MKPIWISLMMALALCGQGQQPPEQKITVIPGDVKPETVWLLRNTNGVPNGMLRFEFAHKASDEVKALVDSGKRVQIKLDRQKGATVLPNAKCSAYLDHSGTNYIGLVLSFKTSAEAIYAKQMLNRVN